MPSIVLFDLGHVLLDWDPARLYERLLGSREEAERFCEEICTMEWHSRHDAGVPLEENRRPLIEAHPDKEDLIRAWETGWLEMFHGYVPGVDTILEQLDAKGIPLFALTNFPHELWPVTVEAFPLLTRFRDVVVSGEEKMVKPDLRIYRLALERMGNPDPGEVFFIDDRQANVDAAREIGMVSERFVGAEKFRADLEAAGLL